MKRIRNLFILLFSLFLISCENGFLLSKTEDDFVTVTVNASLIDSARKVIPEADSELPKKFRYSFYVDDELIREKLMFDELPASFEKIKCGTHTFKVEAYNGDGENIIYSGSVTQEVSKNGAEICVVLTPTADATGNLEYYFVLENNNYDKYAYFEDAINDITSFMRDEYSIEDEDLIAQVNKEPKLSAKLVNLDTNEPVVFAYSCTFETLTDYITESDVITGIDLNNWIVYKLNIGNIPAGNYCLTVKAENCCIFEYSYYGGSTISYSTFALCSDVVVISPKQTTSNFIKDNEENVIKNELKYYSLFENSGPKEVYSIYYDVDDVPADAVRQYTINSENTPYLNFKATDDKPYYYAGLYLDKEFTKPVATPKDFGATFGNVQLYAKKIEKYPMCFDETDPIGYSNIYFEGFSNSYGIYSQKLIESGSYKIILGSPVENENKQYAYYWEEADDFYGQNYYLLKRVNVSDAEESTEIYFERWDTQNIRIEGVYEQDNAIFTVSNYEDGDDSSICLAGKINDFTGFSTKISLKELLSLTDDEIEWVSFDKLRIDEKYLYVYVKNNVEESEYTHAIFRFNYSVSVENREFVIDYSTKKIFNVDSYLVTDASGMYQFDTLTDIQVQDGSVYLLFKKLDTDWGDGIVYSYGALCKLKSSDDTFGIDTSFGKNGFFGMLDVDKVKNNNSRGNVGSNYTFCTPENSYSQSLFGPTKFIAVKPKKLVFADNGFGWWEESGTGHSTWIKMNRIVELDLESMTMSSFVTDRNLGVVDNFLVDIDIGNYGGTHNMVESAENKGNGFNETKIDNSSTYIYLCEF